MYALPYTANDVEPRHYKLEWLSLLGAVAAALALLVVAYFINNQEGLHKVAFICIVVAGFTVALCLAALFAHYYVARKNPKPNRDDPPKYKEAWGRDYYSRRMSELQDTEENTPSISSTLLPHSILQLQCDLPHNEFALRLGSSSHVGSTIPDLAPHSSQSAAAFSSPSSSTCQNDLVTCSATICSSHYADESHEVVNELPSYDEAMQSMDLCSIEKLKHDIEADGD